MKSENGDRVEKRMQESKGRDTDSEEGGRGEGERAGGEKRQHNERRSRERARALGRWIRAGWSCRQGTGLATSGPEATSRLWTQFRERKQQSRKAKEANFRTATRPSTPAILYSVCLFHGAAHLRTGSNAG